MKAIGPRALVVNLLIALVSCSAVQEDPEAGPSPGGAIEEGSPEQYLILTDGLMNTNRVLQLGNEAHVAIQRIFDTPDAFSQEALQNVQAAREVWQEIESALTLFTEEMEQQLDSLSAGIRVLEVAVDAWYDFFDTTERAIQSGGGPGKADRIVSLQEYANGETIAGMGFMQLAAEDAAEKICAIDENDPACFLNIPPPE